MEVTYVKLKEDELKLAGYDLDNLPKEKREELEFAEFLDTGLWDLES